MTLSNRLIIIGIILVVFISAYAYFKALADKKVNKAEMSRGFYILRYPLLLIGELIGLALFIIGCLLN